MILASHGIIGSSIVQFSPQVAADAFYTRVTDAGGSLTTTEEGAILTLITDLASYGLWDKMKAIYPMVGASAAACAQNLKSASFTGTFTAGWTFASTGVTGNGTSAYMDTGLKPSDLGQNSTHLSVYSRTDSNQSTVDMGMYSPGSATYLVYRYSGQIYPAIQTNNFAGFSTPYLTSLGLIVGSRSNSTEEKYYQNATLLGTYSKQSVTPNNVFNIYLACYNSTGTGQLFSTKQFALASLGDGLTDTEAADFYTAVQAFQTTLSRNV